MSNAARDFALTVVFGSLSLAALALKLLFRIATKPLKGNHHGRHRANAKPKPDGNLLELERPAVLRHRVRPARRHDNRVAVAIADAISNPKFCTDPDCKAYGIRHAHLGAYAVAESDDVRRIVRDGRQNGQGDDLDHADDGCGNGHVHEDQYDTRGYNLDQHS